MSDFGEFDTGTFTGPISLASLPRRIGHSDLEVFPLALGAAVFGWTLPSGRSADLLDRFVDLGGSMIDTADAYSSGMSEQIIGHWMRDRGNREQLTIATKVGRHPDYPGLAPGTIRDAVEASLERLQTDYIDLLYFHAPDSEVGLEQSLSAAEELIRSGKVRYLAASNFSADELLHARVLAGNGLPRFEAVGLEYSLMRRDIVEGNLSMMAQAQHVSVMPYFILANGFLGRHRTIKGFNPGDTRARRAAQHGGRHGTHVLRVLDNIAMTHGVDISTVATSWVLGRAGVGIPTIGPESLRELEALMHAPMIRLSRHQLADLDRASMEHTRSWVPARSR